MPTYVYECRACGNRFEVVHRVTDDPLKTCASCSGEVRKVFFPSWVIFKGSGWHITDYARKDGKAIDAESSETKSESKTETMSKTETKTETAAAKKETSG